MQLALETSTNICSVAFRNGKGEIYEKRTALRGSHSENLFLFIRELMEEHGFTIGELESIMVSEGPGSYTGLRISASAVKGLLFRSDVSLFAANTLASFALSAFAKNPELITVHSIIDARRVHLYHQKFSYAGNRLRAADKVEVIPIERFEGMVGAGDGIVGTGLKRIDKQVLAIADVYDADAITAASLFDLADIDGSSDFVKEIDPAKFDPKYYTSGQA